ncbi:MAG: ABC transporter ATP-binding protein [Crocinitomicaceae bacterium]|nr:ABC transporter ATP-binding protein [Crocinitomicaceae bacterium]
MKAIETHQLTKYYGDQPGIIDVSLEIEQGEIFGFIGPNGAGKSTAIRTILGLLKPTSGSAKILGMDTETQGDQLRKKIGYLPSEVNYYDEMSSRELLEYHCRFYGDVKPGEIERLAEYYELDLDKKITDLSFGNKKKCAIIQSIIHEPELLIMDEPTSGLDPLMQNHFFEMMEDLNKKGTTIFMSSHILSEIQRLCDRAAIIRKSEITATEDIRQLLKKQMKKVLLVFETKPDSLELLEGSQKEKWHDNKLSFEYVGATQPLLKWLAELNLLDAVLEEPDLESIFMNYYER